MAYNKVYNRIYWNNDKAPAINATNLNNIESGIDTIDGRVCGIGNNVDSLNENMLSVKSGLMDYEKLGFLSRNILPYNFGFNQTNQGYTVSANNDKEQSYSVKGTSTRNSIIEIPINVDYKGTVIFTCNYSQIGANGNIRIYYDDSSGTTRALAPNETLDLSTNKIKSLAIYMANGNVANITDIKAQLEVGTVSHSYVPYAPPNTEISTLNNSLNDLAYSTKTGVTKNITDVNTFSNSVTDSQTSFKYYFQAMNGTTRVELANGTISANGNYHYTLNLTEKTFDSIQLKHNGATRDIPILSVATSEKGYYTISFNCNGFNPSSVGGLKLDNIMLEKNDHATDYVPYIAQSVKSLNDSLQDFGLNNVFDGQLKSGYYNSSDGEYKYGINDVCNVNKISCSNAKTMTVKNSYGCNSLGFLYFKADGTFLTIDRLADRYQVYHKYTSNVPDDANYCMLSLGSYTAGSNRPITLQNIGHVGVYADNEIESIKADLSGIKHFSFGGSSFTTTINGEIPDGTYLAVITEASSLTAVLSSPVVSFMVIQGGNLYNTFISNGDRVSGIAYSNGTLTITMKAGSYVVAKLIQM